MKKREELSFEMNVGCLIGENSIVEGNFVTQESARIDGEVRGNVKAEEKLLIGVKGKVHGNVTTEAIMISGVIEGDVTAASRVEITSTGVVNGDITTKLLIIDENAVFNGNCKMTKDNIIPGKLDKKDNIVEVQKDKEEKIS